jgi:hypothetical protein
MAQKHPHRMRDRAAQNRRLKQQELKQAKKEARVEARRTREAKP